PGLTPRICGSRPDLGRFAEVIPDNVADSGPLSGIEAALAASDSELNLFLPVDAPLIPVEFLRWLMERATASNAVATIPVAGGREQPLSAIYSRRLLPGLRAAMADGRFKLMAAVRDAAASLGEAIDLFAVEEVEAALAEGVWPEEPPLCDWFLNVNAPADLASVKIHLKMRPGAIRRDPIS
ncbi:MAG: molybdenum cofactor guanylyltransferase, partial [Acidobacteriaceae bacterium]